MDTHGELVQEVLDVVQEASVTPGRVTKLLNDGLAFVASKVLLPELESSGTFTTVANSYYADIPVGWNFGRNLYSARSAEHHVRVLPSIAHLLEKPRVDLDTVTLGSLKYITTANNKLVYFYCPSELTTLFCKFYKAPTKLVAESDIPTCIPSHLRKSLLVNFALMNAYDLKEDGAEGLKVNTGHYKNLFYEALESFDVTVKTGISEPELDRTTTWI
jgi:hypothetical protein